mmetsp:Transcript_11239/g.17053  ORF Transcript_11239/g.17053 Transcript_11239/m.17053 type:complete len:392 (-) Transcript_11239:661-1836(-)|eukprot:CAMPEP_0116010378 /NCGR_PEP_ID=MMETSP0321-20121206/3966_1 /TAXON_ID=163516 /ORGANISM="Leptocylindrus danicus var. danicus, Strain B650" /LENGTH=391 /DNA_ID=CAMNT_0003479467 /DNA_START=274 /DNA_END=1449 /DNA_ORIENTATION=-
MSSRYRRLCDGTVNIISFLTCRTKPGSMHGGDDSGHDSSSIDFVEHQEVPCIVISTSMLDLQNHDMELGRGGNSASLDNTVEDHMLSSSLLDYHSEGNGYSDAESSASTLLQHVAIQEELSKKVDPDIMSGVDDFVSTTAKYSTENKNLDVVVGMRDVTLALAVNKSGELTEEDDPFDNYEWATVACIGFAILMIPNNEFALILIGGYGMYGAAIGLMEEDKETLVRMNSEEKDSEEPFEDEIKIPNTVNEVREKETNENFEKTEQQEEELDCETCMNGNESNEGFTDDTIKNTASIESNEFEVVPVDGAKTAEIPFHSDELAVEKLQTDIFMASSGQDEHAEDFAKDSRTEVLVDTSSVAVVEKDLPIMPQDLPVAAKDLEQEVNVPGKH